jgi:hypothetical protein
MDSAAQAHGPQIKLAAETTVQKPLALSISDSEMGVEEEGTLTLI